MSVEDGPRRPDRYRRYSQTGSGWTIYNNPHAPPDKQWKITHELWGERFFMEHDQILPWTTKHMVDKTKEIQAMPRGKQRERFDYWLAGIDDFNYEMEKAGHFDNPNIRVLGGKPSEEAVQQLRQRTRKP